MLPSFALSLKASFIVIVYGILLTPSSAVTSTSTFLGNASIVTFPVPLIVAFALLVVADIVTSVVPIGTVTSYAYLFVANGSSSSLITMRLYVLSF